MPSGERKINSEINLQMQLGSQLISWKNPSLLNHLSLSEVMNEFVDTAHIHFRKLYK